MNTAVDAVGEIVDLSISTPDGRHRTAHLYLPVSLTDDPAPLLVALQGGTTTSVPGAWPTRRS